MISRFGPAFPSTKIFSEYSRTTLKDLDLHGNPDSALMAYLEREEILFKTLEKHIIGERLTRGFENNVDDFITFSLSVQNRRKSRAGLSLENHLEFLFGKLDIRYSRTAVTENRARPDFLFQERNNIMTRHLIRSV
jgi:hypothetical protein